jgi:scopoletin glucosyltransferase
LWILLHSDQGIVKRGVVGNVACLNRLDGKVNNSVVFVCLGSWCHFTDEQLRELALGLEDSGKNFLWVIRISDDMLLDWMPEKWEERIASRGLICWLEQS